MNCRMRRCCCRSSLPKALSAAGRNSTRQARPALDLGPGNRLPALAAGHLDRAPVGELVDIMDVGYACAYLATTYARRITGESMYIDGGVNIVA
jgi:NAD(P)-dependent dehydrogenase (short-subunit alcohol dehydrogenase family)